MDTAAQSAPNNEPTAGTSNAPAQTTGRKKSLPIGQLVAELVGTFLFAGAVIATSGQPLYVFFVIVGIVAMIGSISGAHINPAITIAAAITRRLTPLRALGYIVAQMVGAMLAFITLSSLLGGTPEQVNQATGQLAPAEIFKVNPLTEGKEWYAFFAEILGAAILGFGVAHALTEKRERFTSAFSVGAGLLIGLMLAGATAVLNPAVAMAVQALRFDVWAIVVYAVGPIIGATIGFLIFKLIQKTTPVEEQADKTESV